jgi:hypothetical protein
VNEFLTFAINWLPLFVIFALLGIFSRHHMRSYGKHVDRVNSLNEQVLALSHKTHDIAARQLDALNEIKSLLESRKI